jgi:beta-mannanase
MNTELLKTTNMERKLELKDICGYLPYRLNIKYYKSDIIICVQYLGLYSEDIEYYDCNGASYNQYYATPILRPLSDLYRRITHNGKEIIPMVELAKIAEPNYVWKINKKMAIREIIYETWTDKIYFGYTGLHRYFKSTKRDGRYFYSMYQDDNVEYIPDQIPLFDYLHELKIDYRGLIDSGLAIDANNLETNPYK